MQSENARCSLWKSIRLIIGSELYMRPQPPNSGEKKYKPTKKERRSGMRPRTRDRSHIRGERDTVVDGYQTVEHERCFVQMRMRRPLSGANNGLRFAVRTYELAESIDIGILVGGR
jgi:hypothetical protein